MRFQTRAQQITELLKDVDLPSGAPVSALKAFRGEADLSQTGLASRSGISQPHISEVESGRKPLTGDVARKLAPALGVDAVELEAAEGIATLHAAALKGKVDPRMLLDTVLELAKTLPDSDLSDQVVTSLLSVLKLALERHDEKERAMAKVSTKSARSELTRTGLGASRRKVVDSRRY